MPDRDDLRTNPRETPLVGRPRGAAWRTLQADGVVWEGQVFLVGDDVDLAARMIVTHRSVAFARGGAIVLDIPRAWLRPAPMLKWDGTVVLSISAPGSTPYSEPDTLPIRMRDGHQAAGHVIAMFAGSGARRLHADAPPGDDFARAMLPPLPGASAPAALPERAGRGNGAPASIFDDPDVFPDRRNTLPRSAPATNGTAANGSVAGLDPIVRQPAPPISGTTQRDWNLQAPLLANHLVPRSHRRNRWAWALRLGGLVGLLAAAALFGTGHIPPDFGGLRGAPPALPSATAATVRATRAPGAAQLEPSAAAELASQQTAVALGVGGQDDEPAVVVTPPVVPTFPPAAAANSAEADKPAKAGKPAPPIVAAKPTEPPPAPTTAPPTSAPTQAPPPAAAPTGSDLAVAVETATRGATLPQFGLPPSNDGDWLPLIVSVTNQGSAPAQFAMNQAQLRSQPGDAISPLDSGSGVIAGLVGIDPALGPNDVLSLDPGQTKKVLLLFLVPPSSDQYVLQFGPTTVDLGTIR